MKTIEKEKQDAWEKLAVLDVIPATIDNIRIVLFHLNTQNWGTWKLPKLSISYTANQYDCDGIIATTMKLDEPITDHKYGIENETLFKVGGKRGHLSKYTKL